MLTLMDQMLWKTNQPTYHIVNINVCILESHNQLLQCWCKHWSADSGAHEGGHLINGTSRTSGGKAQQWREDSEWAAPGFRCQRCHSQLCAHKRWCLEQHRIAAALALWGSVACCHSGVWSQARYSNSLTPTPLIWLLPHRIAAVRFKWDDFV